jgi:hypothetical protein
VLSCGSRCRGLIGLERAQQSQELYDQLILTDSRLKIFFQWKQRMTLNTSAALLRHDYLTSAENLVQTLCRSLRTYKDQARDADLVEHSCSAKIPSQAHMVEGVVLFQGCQSSPTPR